MRTFKVWLENEHEFWRHMVRNPEDIAGLAAYSDWLEEQGQAPKATAVRLIINLETRHAYDHLNNPEWRHDIDEIYSILGVVRTGGLHENQQQYVNQFRAAIRREIEPVDAWLDNHRRYKIYHLLTTLWLTPKEEQSLINNINTTLARIAQTHNLPLRQDITSEVKKLHWYYIERYQNRSAEIEINSIRDSVNEDYTADFWLSRFQRAVHIVDLAYTEPTGSDTLMNKILHFVESVRTRG